LRFYRGGEDLSTIRLELSDWLYNAGIVGVVNILQHSDVNVTKKGNYVEFEASELENFEEKYFKYFIDKYLKFTSWYKIISFEDFIDNFNFETINEKQLNEISDYIEYTKKKLTSNSYKNGYGNIENKSINLIIEEKKLRKIKLGKKQQPSEVTQQIQEQFETLKLIINYLKLEEVKRALVAKNIIYDVIQNFWEGVSFLHKSKNTEDVYNEYKSYFINPAFEYLEKDKDKYKFHCFSCNNKIQGLSKNSSYELTWIGKMGVDSARKSSHFWNMNSDAYVCPVCNLVYSCIPAGFTVLRGKGLFINENSSMDRIIAVNTTNLNHTTKMEELEDEIYFNILGTLDLHNVGQSVKEIDNIQVVKLDVQNERRPYTFNILSKEMITIMQSNRNRLKPLIKANVKLSKDYYLNLYKEVVKRLYDGRNQFDLINTLISLRLQNEFKDFGYIEMILKINHDFLQRRGGNRKMAYYFDIEKAKESGVKLRRAYINKSSENKLGGIVYRLLNALRIKDTAKFMDTLISSHLYIGESISNTFVSALGNIDTFQTIGYAFLLGLQGELQKNTSNDNQEELKNE
jgi:CRISPR-associated protein Cst1